jgi:hypothetical protein
MQKIDLIAFLPREAFLTECKAVLPSAEELQNELLAVEREFERK